MANTVSGPGSFSGPGNFTGVSANASVTVTGGTLITSDPTYYYRVFTANDDMVISGGSVEIETLIIGGGGG